MKPPANLAVVVRYALVAGIVLAATVVIAELSSPAAESSGKSVSPARLAESNFLPAYTLPPVEQGFPETVTRPLFVPGRRPPPPAQLAQGSMPRGQFVLVGTSVTPTLGDIAVLKHVPTNKTYSVRRGEQVQGVTVEQVAFDKVILRLGDETEEVAMRTAKGAPVPPVRPGMPGGAPAPAGVQGAPGAVPPAQPAAVPPSGAPAQPVAGQPLTAEQILARRRAARAQQTQ